MELEIGFKMASNPLTISVEDADKISETVSNAIANNDPIDITDAKGDRILIPSDAIAYTVIRRSPRHSIGFGVL